MKLTTKGRYAVTAMMDLALHSKHRCVALTDIAERQQISLAYLEQLFSNLRKAGLVTSIRGRSGGYRVAKSTSEISLAEILNATNECLDLTCGSGDNCQPENPCLTHSLWTRLSNELFEFLHSKKLDELIHSRHVQQLATAQTTKIIGNIPVVMDS